MLFNSHEFFLFSLLFFPIYFLLKSLRSQNLFLLVSSYIFYGAWDYRFLSLIFLSTVVDYFVARAIEKSNNKTKRKYLLAISISVNLLILGSFKYAGFFLDSFQHLMGSLGLSVTDTTLRIVLPVGISFYTFQSLGYTIDVYRHKMTAVKNFNEFSLFVCYFPQLVAGPIEQAKNLIPQLQKKRTVNRENIKKGLLWLIQGYFFKNVIADSLDPFVTHVFDHHGSVNGIISLLGVIGFSLQIYMDFAGYSLIARGLAKIMGIDLMRNFERPYLATNPSEFWRRWHISLSDWFRRNLYISLGGNQSGTWVTARNLFITMGLAGLWHGASWNFVLWGLFHGLILILWHGAEKFLVPHFSRWVRLIGLPLTYFGVLLGWVIFRAENLSIVWSILNNIVGDFTWSPETMAFLKPVLTFFTFLAVVEIIIEKQKQRKGGIINSSWMVLGEVIFMLVCLFSVQHDAVPFIYFQF